MTLRSLALAALVAAPGRCPPRPRRSGIDKPVYVDQQLAGGEPLCSTDTVHTLLYTAHEGTTHIYRPGLVPRRSTSRVTTATR